MKTISLKKPVEKSSKDMAVSLPKESYPSFTIYDKAPEELMKCPMGCKMMANIVLTSKDDHEGQNSRKSVGFDVISVMVEEKPTKKVQKSGATEYME